MHSPGILKLLQRVLAPPVPRSLLEPEEERISPQRPATVLDSDDDMGLGGQQVALDGDLLKQLRFFFPDTLILAAFDIVDRDGGEPLFFFQEEGWVMERERVSRQIHLSARAGPVSSSGNQEKFLRISLPPDLDRLGGEQILL